MNEQTDRNSETPADADETAAEGAAPAETTGDPATAPAEASPVETLAAENAELRDRLMRAIADMENLRRRTEREKQDAGRYAIGRFAEDILSVGDNLARALATVDEATRTDGNEATRNLIEGIEVTERGLQNVLSRHGISRIEPDGERFDPNFHQAIYEVENPAVTAGTVVQVLQAGYMIGERVLRPAMVAVAKGGPRAGAEGQAAATETPANGASDPAQPGHTVDKSA
jgi:molecular chaperone GrpE